MQKCYAIGQINIVTNGQMFKNNLTIWSHCSPSSSLSLSLSLSINHSLSHKPKASWVIYLSVVRTPLSLSLSFCLLQLSCCASAEIYSFQSPALIFSPFARFPTNTNFLFNYLVFFCISLSFPAYLPLSSTIFSIPFAIWCSLPKKSSCRWISSSSSRQPIFKCWQKLRRSHDQTHTKHILASTFYPQGAVRVTF